MEGGRLVGLDEAMRRIRQYAKGGFIPSNAWFNSWRVSKWQFVIELKT